MCDHQEILQYWDQDSVESMADKHLLNAEIELIWDRIPPHSKVLDAGCGEGEGTLAYSAITGVVVHAVDFSDTRIRKAEKRLKGLRNVYLKKVDLTGNHSLDHDYSIIVSQRFLINLTDWEVQKKVLLNLMSLLNRGGRLLMLEGSKQGADSLNEFRAAWGLDPIPVRWHNLFFDDQMLVEFMEKNGHDLLETQGLGAYFMLTRGIRPNLDRDLNWDCEFNRRAATKRIKDLLNMNIKFSRLKLWVFQK